MEFKPSVVSSASPFVINFVSADPIKEKKVKEGEKKTRLVLIGNRDSRYAIATKIIKGESVLANLQRLFTESFLKHRYVQINPELVGQTKDSKVFVDVHSIVKRCGLQKDAILATRNERGGGQTLLNMIKSSIPNDQQVSVKKERPKKQVAQDVLTGVLKTLDKNKKTYLITYKKGDSDAKTYTLSKLLGKGVFGQVYAVENSRKTNQKDEDPFQALKIPHENVTRAVKDLENEWQILHKVNPDGTKEGIERPGHKVISITPRDSSAPPGKIIGVLKQRYDKNFLDHIQESPLESKEAKKMMINYLSECAQLLKGLATLHENNILHGDLKPENIFVKTEGNRTLVHISDLGGAREVSKSNGDWKEQDLIHTPCYTLKREIDHSIQCQDSGDYQNYVESEKKRDVFAMGAILYKRFNQGDLPYLFKEEESLYPGGFTEKYKEWKKQQENTLDPTNKMIRRMLVGMLNQNPKSRWTASKAFQEVDSLLQELLNSPATISQ